MLRLSLFKIPESKPVYFTKEELDKLLTAMQEGVLKNAIIFAVYTGCRQAEILNLKWSDMDFKQKQIKISNSDGFTIKTGKERVIPMHSELESMLSRIHRRSVYVFTKSSGYRFQGCHMSHTLKKYVRNLNLGEK